MGKNRINQIEMGVFFAGVEFRAHRSKFLNKSNAQRTKSIEPRVTMGSIAIFR